MKTIIKKISISLLLLSSLLVHTANAKIEIVSFVPAIDSLVKDLTKGTDANVINLISYAEELHNFTITPSKLENLIHADAVILVGYQDIKDLNKKRLVELRNNKHGIINLLEKLDEHDLHSFECGIHHHSGDEEHDDHHEDDHDDHKHDEHHDDEDHDEHEEHDNHDDHHNDHDDHHGEDECLDIHVWYSPKLIEESMEIIAKELIKLDDSNAKTYKTNLRNIKRNLIKLDDDLEDLYEASTKYDYVFWANVFLYHIDEYIDTKIFNVETGDAHNVSVSGKKLQDISEFATRSNNACIVFSSAADMDSHQAIFSEIPNLKTTYVDLFEVIENYETFLLNLGKNLSSCQN